MNLRQQRSRMLRRIARGWIRNARPAAQATETNGNTNTETAMPPKPNYKVIQSDDNLVLIRDVGPWDRHPTVTNGAEDVVAELAASLKGRRLEYFDSLGDRAEILVKDGKFAGFKAVSEGE
jgi:hypothetical protein